MRLYTYRRKTYINSLCIHSYNTHTLYICAFNLIIKVNNWANDGVCAICWITCMCVCSVYVCHNGNYFTTFLGGLIKILWNEKLCCLLLWHNNNNKMPNMWKRHQHHFVICWRDENEIRRRIYIYIIYTHVYVCRKLSQYLRLFRRQNFVIKIVLPKKFSNRTQ